jgi:hypothetical protein
VLGVRRMRAWKISSTVRDQSIASSNIVLRHQRKLEWNVKKLAWRGHGGAILESWQQKEISERSFGTALVLRHTDAAQTDSSPANPFQLVSSTKKLCAASNTAVIMHLSPTHRGGRRGPQGNAKISTHINLDQIHTFRSAIH